MGDQQNGISRGVRGSGAGQTQLRGSSRQISPGQAVNTAEPPRVGLPLLSRFLPRSSQFPHPKENNLISSFTRCTGDFMTIFSLEPLPTPS